MEWDTSRGKKKKTTNKTKFDWLIDTAGTVCLQRQTDQLFQRIASIGHFRLFRLRILT